MQSEDVLSEAVVPVHPAHLVLVVLDDFGALDLGGGNSVWKMSVQAYVPSGTGRCQYIGSTVTQCLCQGVQACVGCAAPGFGNVGRPVVAFFLRQGLPQGT